jgi:Na+/H+ antiporter NhaD/arsenite permease-like protein
VINVHNGFQVVTKKLYIHSKKRMLWITSLVTFFLSSVLDNLTTTIVMVSLIAKIVEQREERWLLGGAIVIAANSGGAWTPIGDVATTLLWISGEVTTTALIGYLFLPSLIGLAASFLWLGRYFHGRFEFSAVPKESSEPGSRLVLCLGVCALVFVPVFKILTGLPPFMGMMLGVGVMWAVTDILHYKNDEKQYLRLVYVLPKVDVSIILFYLGVLLSINALESAGLLKSMAEWIDGHLSSNLIPVLIGLISSIVDNVSLVAAAIGMYGIDRFGIDSAFWLAIAYAAGTGGSILIIGSAAGVALMALEKVDFMWYLRRVAIPALAAYFVGLGIFWTIIHFSSHT